jgi:thiol:disulfide interchange protein DsbD
MVYAKKIMGALLFAAAFYFLNPVLPGPLYHSLVIVALVAAGLYFGFFEPTPAKTWKFRAVRYLFAVVFIGIAIWWGMPEEGATNISGIAWRPYSENALQKAKSEGRPVIIDIFADWCIPCKELDKFAFSDSRVVEASKSIMMLKANITAGGTPETKKIITRFGVKGVPTIIFIRSDGAEEPDLRINQLEKADFVLERINSLLTSSQVPAKPLAGDGSVM